MNQTLGYRVFNSIDSNSYLKELYESILYNYSIKLLKRTDISPCNFELEDALRFADLLSKSTDSKNSETHRIWAQEIVALLSNLYPDNEIIPYYMGSVLTNISNYQGLAMHPGNFTATNVLDQAYTEFKKNYLKIPTCDNDYFFQSQKQVFDSLTKDKFSYSGPTSMGKSFIMRMFIKDRIEKNVQENYAIIVPTKALINEVSSQMITDLKGLLAEKNYRVITAAGTLSLQQPHNFILVLTPERLLYLLLDHPDFKLDYLFVDEAHKISSKDSRSPFYYKIIDLLSSRKDKPHFIFSSPNIPNPEIYLKLTSGNVDMHDKLTTSFSPVSQLKYIIDLVDKKIKLHNDHSNSFIDIPFYKREVTLSDLIQNINHSQKSIIYCSSTANAVDYAREYARLLGPTQRSEELISLSRDIRNEIHSDYYLADLILKGVAYHIGYLPSHIRMRIEDLFREGDIKTVFCTSTLVEGINLPADNLFVTSYKNGLSNMNPVDFRNLIGRVGRIKYNLYGNVFLVRLNSKAKEGKYEQLIEEKIPDQKLSIVSELTKPQKQKIVDSLLAGNIELVRYPKSQSVENYSLMRKFALILLKDIITNNASLVHEEFSTYLSPEKEAQICKAFQQKPIDNDINVSSDQIENMSAAIAKGLRYPTFNAQGNIDYNELVVFLEKLCVIFKWDKYEASTLGHISKRTGKHGKLRWYAVILAQWIQGNGLNIIMTDAIKFKQFYPKSGVEINGVIVDYEDSKLHRNIVISDTLNAIEDVILFRISNYFLRFSTEYKHFHNLDVIENDWYEFVEYGTTNPLTIFLQRNGFSRETATYIKKHREYIHIVGNEYKLDSSLSECSSKAVCKEVSEMKYNVPELFIN